jgi:hypothetical protein
MSESMDTKNIPPMLSDERVMTWMEEHLTELRHSASGQQLLYRSLMISFVVGLAAHVGGYVLLTSVPTGPLGLLADLLHAFGWSLWTGVVVVVFVQVIPEAKKRQLSQALDAYEQLRASRAQADGDPEQPVMESPHGRQPRRKHSKKAPTSSRSKRRTRA